MSKSFFYVLVSFGDYDAYFESDELLVIADNLPNFHLF